MHNSEFMAADDYQALADYLPETVLQIAGVAGWEATAKLINDFGGSQFPVGRGKRECGEPRRRMLAAIMTPEQLEAFAHTFGGESSFAIPRCDRAKREWRNRRFINALLSATAAGESKRMAMTVLCPRFGIGHTTAWGLLRRYGVASAIRAR
jgi:hypothetical protein